MYIALFHQFFQHMDIGDNHHQWIHGKKPPIYVLWVS
jgi:hypothetical protein